LMGDFCHILSGAVGEEGEDGREECAGCGCQKNLKDGQNRGNGEAGRGTVSISRRLCGGFFVRFGMVNLFSVGCWCSAWDG
ncbi:hypothetical protein, partial [Xylella fastidiosa]|uniref:hypothetical protein n=2 Tax=Xylella fastidiosa TaxID=2371 RepID=UPI000A79509F